jgi:general secretion pathway protein G
VRKVFISLLAAFAILFAISWIAPFVHPPRPSPMARIAEAQTEVDSIGKGIEMFKADTGHLPSRENVVLELLQRPQGETHWQGPYLNKMPTDPWGHDYVCRFPGKQNPNSFDLFSVGPDGRAGTDDDIVNWKK